MIRHDPKAIRYLLENPVSLSSFYTKIEMVKKLEWVQQWVSDDFHCMREMRNCFAHDFELKNFSDKPIADLLSRLAGYKKAVEFLLKDSKTVSARMDDKELQHAVESIDQNPRNRISFAVAIYSIYLPILLEKDANPDAKSGSQGY